MTRPIPPRWALAAILVLAATLRLIRLESTPPGLFCDEVAIATNARSIGTTGKDLSGTFLPLYAEERSFERWGGRGIIYQPVYLYAEIPFVMLLGFSRTTVKLPSVLFGLAGVVGVYVLGRALFGERCGLLSALFLAVCPWHLQFSRIAFEAISLPVFLAFGAWFLFRGLLRPGWLAAGAATLAASTYAYPTAKVFAPLLLLGFAFIYRRKLFRNRRACLLAAVAAAAVAVPNLYLIAVDRHQERARQLFIGKAELGNERATRYLLDHDTGSSIHSEILNHRALQATFVFLYNYAGYFSPDFLFLSGDPNLRHNPRGVGMWLLWFLPLFLAGAVALLRRRGEPRIRFLLWWFLIYPVAASLTIESPHAIRSMTGVIAFAILAALGAGMILDRIRPASVGWNDSPRGRKVFLVACWGFLLLGIADLAHYLLVYHREYPRSSGEAWSSGYREAFEALERDKSVYGTKYLSKRIDNGFLFALYHGDVDFRSLDRESDLNDRLRPHRYQIVWESPPALGPKDVWLLTAGEREAARDVRTIGEFPYPDGTPHLFLVRAADGR